MYRTIFASAAVALTIAAFTAAPTAALGPFCSKPSKPYCADFGNKFDSESAYESCRGQVRQYLSSVDDYVDCLREAQRTARDESSKVVQRFNCKAKGESFCF